MNRTEQIASAFHDTYDICIIGGGITGAGILYQAVKQGFKAILVERNDFASGTSSRSSKMIHGGLRYLKNLQFGLVKEALTEREHLLNLYPHLVKPIEYIIPSYGSFFDKVSKQIGLSMYDKLAGDTSLPLHKTLSTQDVIKQVPGIDTKKLSGGISYWDAHTNDARLVLQVISECQLLGATALNYSEVVQINTSDHAVSHLTCKDKISQTEFEIRADVYISAAGVWTDAVSQLLDTQAPPVMEPSKGVHIVIPTSRMYPDKVVLIEASSGDGRFIYNLPWENGLTILGTTDTDYQGNPDDIHADKSDIDYLLKSFNKSFPGLKLSEQDITSVYFGLRPMLSDRHGTDSTSRSREYKIWWNTPNMLSIAGGKLTSFLSMGEHCVEVAKKILPSPTKQGKDLPSHTSENWDKTYGQLGYLVAQIEQEDPSNREVISTHYRYTVAEIKFFIRHQFAQTLSDILTRRTSITYGMKTFEQALSTRVAQILADELHKPEGWIELEISNYQKDWELYHSIF